MTVREALESRRATPAFDPSVEISRSELDRLVSLAILAPSSLNLQPWELILCHSREDKARLRQVSFGQRKVEDASAVFVVLGDLLQHEHAARIAQSNINRGYFGEERRQGFIDMAYGAYAQDPQRQRDEAFRGGGLFAMALMLAAREASWDTAPLGGFDPLALCAEFAVPETHVPVLLVAIGKLSAEITLLPRNERFGPDEITHEGRF